MVTSNINNVYCIITCGNPLSVYWIYILYVDRSKRRQGIELVYWQATYSSL
jgi:hypothetical protein